MAKKSSFYRAKVVIEVVADRPIDFENLSDLSQKITEGDWVGNYKIEEHESISKREAAEIITRLDSDPEFLGIDSDELVSESAIHCLKRYIKIHGSLDVGSDGVRAISRATAVVQLMNEDLIEDADIIKKMSFGEFADFLKESLS